MLLPVVQLLATLLICKSTRYGKSQTMKNNVLLMPGEGIGPEIVQEGARVLKAVTTLFDINIEISEHMVGDAQFAQSGRYLSTETERLCDVLQTNSQAAILFGAVADEPIGILRKRYDLFTNLRPIRPFPQIASASPFRPERLQGTDILIVRELVSGIYYGDVADGRDAQGYWAKQTMYYHENEMRRITRQALRLANKRRRQLHLVHKGNVIVKLFELWLSILYEEGQQYPDVSCHDILVDNMAMQMVLRPQDFDVLLCSNMFGDILSDLGAGIVGSIGLLPSASLNEHGFGLFESVGGTAPDIAGLQKANPVSTILSVAMMCRHTFKHEEAAKTIETAVNQTLLKYRTPDIYEPGYELVSTSEIGLQIVAALQQSKTKR